MQRQYVDISHFRAPYKNWMSLTGLGAAAVVSKPSSLPPAVAAMVFVEPGGSTVLEPAVANAVWLFLSGRVVEIVGTDDDVKLMLPIANDPREAAMSWINRKLAQGKSVLAGSMVGVAGLAMPGEAIVKLLKAVPSAGPFAPSAQEVLNTSGGQYAILKRPPTKTVVQPAGRSLAALLTGPVGIALAVLVGVGAVAYFAKPKRKHATTNRRHRRAR